MLMKRKLSDVDVEQRRRRRLPVLAWPTASLVDLCLAVRLCEAVTRLGPVAWSTGVSQSLDTSIL